MIEKWNEVRTQTLRPDEVEALLAKEFGGKITPVNQAELAKKHRSQERQQDNKKTAPPG